MLHLVQHHLALLHPLPGVMTALALRTSLILVFEFHAVCRCTICGAQADSEARIPGITMTARVYILTKTVTNNPQTDQPKFANQLFDSQLGIIFDLPIGFPINSIISHSTRTQT